MSGRRGSHLDRAVRAGAPSSVYSPTMPAWMWSFTCTTKPSFLGYARPTKRPRNQAPRTTEGPDVFGSGEGSVVWGAYVAVQQPGARVVGDHVRIQGGPGKERELICQHACAVQHHAVEVDVVDVRLSSNDSQMPPGPTPQSLRVSLKA